MTTPENPGEDTIREALDGVEDALGTGTATASDPAVRELQEIALALRADAPEPRAEYGAAMDEWARGGFTRDERPGMRPRRGIAGRSLRGAAALRGRLPSSSPLARISGSSRAGLRRALGSQRPALAVAASALLTLAVVVALEAGGGESPRGASDGTAITESPGGGGSSGSADAAAPEAAEGTDLGAAPALPDDPVASSVPPEPPGGGGIAPDADRRRVERFFDLRLATPEDRMEDVARQIVTVTARHDGFVASSSLRTGEARPGGRFELRIPRRKVRAAVTELSGLGTVVSSSERGEDVTVVHESAEDELAAARAERRSLLRRLERATKSGPARALRARLRLVSAEIRRLTDRLTDLRERSDLARVTVTLSRKEAGIGGGAVGDLGDAVDDAVGVVLGSAGVLIRVLGVALPFTLLGGAVWLGGRALRRRRRDAALA